MMRRCVLKCHRLLKCFSVVEDYDLFGVSQQWVMGIVEFVYVNSSVFVLVSMCVTYVRLLDWVCDCE